MLSSVFLSATNHLLSQSGWARQRLQPHAGRTARLALAPLGEIDFCIAADGQFSEWAGEGEPEVTLRFALAELPQLLANGLGSAMRHVRIEGNAEFAEALGFVFRHLRWDAEEDLSRLFGDIAAHRIVGSGRKVLDEGKRSMERAGGSLAEYLTEEASVLTPRAFLVPFTQQLIALRDDLARLEKRVTKLERKH